MPPWGALLDTKGPEIRTAMLRGGKNILLEQGQTIIIEAVGDSYTSFEGYKEDGETRIGLSYSKLCSSVQAGNRILLADGSISIEAEAVLSATELRGRVLNTQELGQRKNCNLPGVKVDLPVLTDRDIDDLQSFACKHDMDFVAASFVQSAADVQLIRSVLDSAGGHAIKIIAKIENQEGLNNFAEILDSADGIMVARGDLGAMPPPQLFMDGNVGSQGVISSAALHRSVAAHCSAHVVFCMRPLRRTCACNGAEWLASLCVITSGNSYASVLNLRLSAGMEIPAQKVPLAQKWMITQANLSSKLVVCATQMLESMIQNPRPTRAEMTDVSNAVIDGALCSQREVPVRWNRHEHSTPRAIAHRCTHKQSGR